MLFQLLARDGNNVLENLTAADQLRLKKGVTEAILGTDMTKHFGICSTFDAVVKKIKEGRYEKSPDDRDVGALAIKYINFILADPQDHRARSRHQQSRHAFR
jgi:hypothetical protein